MSGEAKAKDRHVGRRASKKYTGGTEPGRILLLAVVSAMPIVWLFILGPVLRPGVFTLDAYPTWRFFFLVGTPLLSIAAVVTFYRAPPRARTHNAAKAGRMLAFANGVLWLLYGGLYILIFVFKVGGEG